MISVLHIPMFTSLHFAKCILKLKRYSGTETYTHYS